MAIAATDHILRELEQFNCFNDVLGITKYLRSLDHFDLALFAAQQYMRAEELRFNNYSDL